MKTVIFDTYRDAFMFLFAARQLGFTVTIDGSRVTVTSIACDDAQWEWLDYLVGPRRQVTPA